MNLVSNKKPSTHKASGTETGESGPVGGHGGSLPGLDECIEITQESEIRVVMTQRQRQTTVRWPDDRSKCASKILDEILYGNHPFMECR